MHFRRRGDERRVWSAGEWYCVDDPVDDVEEHERCGEDTATHPVHPASLLLTLRVDDSRRLALVWSVLNDVDLQNQRILSSQCPPGGTTHHKNRYATRIVKSD